MADFALLDSSTLISRKIWEIEKSWNFHTVYVRVGNTVKKGQQPKAFATAKELLFDISRIFRGQ